MWCNRGCFRLLGGPDRRPRVCIFRPSIFILMTWCVELVCAHVGDREREREGPANQNLSGDGVVDYVRSKEGSEMFLFQ